MGAGQNRVKKPTQSSNEDREGSGTWGELILSCTYRSLRGVAAHAASDPGPHFVETQAGGTAALDPLW